MPEIDLIGADREPIARSITFAGSIKWLDTAPFIQADLIGLVTNTQLVPGIDATDCSEQDCYDGKGGSTYTGSPRPPVRLDITRAVRERPLT